MMVRIGTCSLCGSDVLGFQGAWMSVTPPPPPRCSGCGAVAAADVIQMAPAPQRTTPYRYETTIAPTVYTSDYTISEWNGQGLSTAHYPSGHYWNDPQHKPRRTL